MPQKCDRKGKTGYSRFCLCKLRGKVRATGLLAGDPVRTELYQFHISHFCEKIRWALDYKGVRYRKISFIPGRHFRRIKKLSGQTSVPVLRHGDQVVAGSAAILEFLDNTFPQHPLISGDQSIRRQILHWETRLDALGVDIRLWLYHQLLPHPQLMIPLLTSGQSPMKRWLVRWNYQRIEQGIRHWMKINADTAAAAQTRIEAMLTELRACYSQRHFLAGEHFSRADLTACALFAMLFQPAEYPVPWPSEKRLPPVLKDWLQRNNDLLEPLRVRYAQYR